MLDCLAKLVPTLANAPTSAGTPTWAVCDQVVHSRSERFANAPPSQSALAAERRGPYFTTNQFLARTLAGRMIDWLTTCELVVGRDQHQRRQRMRRRRRPSGRLRGALTRPDVARNTWLLCCVQLGAIRTMSSDAAGEIISWRLRQLKCRQLRGQIRQRVHVSINLVAPRNVMHRLTSKLSSGMRPIPPPP